MDTFCISTSTPDTSLPLLWGDPFANPVLLTYNFDPVYAVPCPTSTATSTVDLTPLINQLSQNQTQNNLFSGFTLFFVTVFLFVIIFVWITKSPN